VEFTARCGSWVWVPKGVLQDSYNIIGILQEKLPLLDKRKNLCLCTSPQPVESISHTQSRCSETGRVAEQFNTELGDKSFKILMTALEDWWIRKSIGSVRWRSFQGGQTVDNSVRCWQPLFEIVGIPLRNCVRGIQDDLGEPLNFGEGRFEGSLLCKAATSNNEVELPLNLIRKLAVDRWEDKGVWSIAGGHRGRSLP